MMLLRPQLALLSLLLLLASGPVGAVSIQVIDSSVRAQVSVTSPPEPDYSQTDTDATSATAESPGAIGPFSGAFPVVASARSRVTATAGAGEIRVSGFADAISGLGDLTDESYSDFDATVDFSLGTSAAFLLATSGSALRAPASIPGSEAWVQLTGASGTVHSFTRSSSRTGSGLFKPFADSATGMLLAGDYTLDVFGRVVVHPYSPSGQPGDLLRDVNVLDIDVVFGIGNTLDTLANGGQIVFDAGTPGAITSTYDVTADLASVLDAGAAAVANFAIAGSQAQVWNIDFSGQLDGGATIQLAYDDSLLAGVSEGSLAVQHFDANTGTWELLTGVVDVENDLITVHTGSLSPFVLSVVPEPGSGWLVLLGLGALTRVRRRVA